MALNTLKCNYMTPSLYFKELTFLTPVAIRSLCLLAGSYNIVKRWFLVASSICALIPITGRATLVVCSYYIW